MKLMSCAVAVLGWAVAVQAQEGAKESASHQEAVEILKKVDAATKALELVKYDAVAKQSRREGMPEVSGSVILGGEKSGRMPQKYRVEGEYKDETTSEARKLVIGGNGEEYYLIDHKNKKVYVDIDPQVIGKLGSPLQALVTIEFTHPSPFSDEINADKAELLGKEKIGEEECHKIHVVYQEGRGEAVWWVGVKDHLPRQRKDVGEVDGRGFEVVRTMTNLVVDPKFVKNPFSLEIPEGYERVDDFAP